MPKTKAATTQTGAAARARHRAPTRVGMLGLGIMGSAMGVNLIQAGFAVVGFDPRPGARRQLERAGGQAVLSMAEVARSASVLLVSLPSAQALDEATHALQQHAKRGTVVIETSTLALPDKQRAHDALAQAGVVLLDCPLSGTGAQAVNKDLTVYGSGDTRALRRVRPVLQGFSHTQFDLGAFGNGMRMKLMANLLVAVHNVAAAEALLMGEAMGIDPALAVQVLQGGAGGSRMLQVRGPMMAKRGWRQATMKLDVWHKDMTLIAQALAQTHVAAPTFAATQPVYHAAIGLGHAKHDTGAVYNVLAAMSGQALAAAPRSGRRQRAGSK